ncbi:ABC transporter ATP-binding protein [Guggenheimella bovis]
MEANGHAKKGVWKKFFRLMSQAKIPWKLIFVSVFINLVATKVTMMFPDYQMQLTMGDLSPETIRTALLILIGGSILTIIYVYLSGYTTCKINRNVLNLVWEKVVELPLSIYQRINPKELISRITTDTTAMGALFVDVIGSLLAHGYALYLALTYLAGYHPTLLTVQLIMIPLWVFLKWFQGRLTFNFTYKQQFKLANLTEYLSQVLVNVPLVKAFVKEDHEKMRGQQAIKELNKARYQLTAIDTIFLAIGDMMGTINTVLSVVIGLSLIEKGEIDIAIWISYYLYSEQISSAVGMITMLWPELKAAQGSIERVNDFMEEKSESYEGVPVHEDVQDIVFKDVTFSYGERTILNDVDLIIPKKKFTAIVGASGAGKTTLLGLIERFFLPQEGTIIYDGKNINEYDLKDWRRKFGYVTQEIKLFSGTIRENIIYGMDNVSDEEIVLAAQKAGIHDTIMSFEDGYETVLLENGEGLSGGERQRIALTRILLKAPDIILLDEATSNLDAESEYLIMNSLSELCKGRTTIAVAHRMRTIENADQIVVLDMGQIKDIGTHEELKERSPFYKRLLECEFSSEEACHAN